MPTIAEVREKFPQYSDMSDAALASALHQKYYSDIPVDQFNEKIGLKPDKYRQAALDERADMQAKGIYQEPGYARRFVQGRTFNAADEVIAAATVPFEMIKQGTLDPREAYGFTKAREDLLMEGARANTGGLGTVLEVVGGAGSGIDLARGGITAARNLAPNAGLGARTVASTVDAAAMGGLAGLLEGNSLNERLGNAGTGAAIGGAAGAVLPGAVSVLGQVASPILSNPRARINPEGYARNQVARAVVESGRTPQQIADEIAAASRDGQSMFTAADAMGNAGQRMLSTVTRAPGAGRTDVVDFLNARQAGQSRRVANALGEGFDAPQTAAQTERRLTTARDTAADAEYGAVRADAQPVDVTRIISRIDDTLAPGVTRFAAPSNLSNDGIESVLQKYRGRLTDGQSNLTDFTAIQRVRGELSDDIQAAVNAGAGNKARLLRGVLREFDDAMEAASAGHRQANRNFAQASGDIEAVQTGRDAAMRGRTEDTIPAFQALRPEAQQAFRAGYSDPIIATAQAQPFGANAARPLTSAAFIDEAAAIAPRNRQLQARIGRENTMFSTRNAALGNSKTVENFADDAAMGIDPTIVSQILSGNYAGATRSLIAAGSNAITGNTPAVREAVGRLLLARGNGVAPQNFTEMIEETVARIQRVQRTAREAGRAAAGGLAEGTSTRKSRKLARRN